jgi:uncharacterized transporter YbjL
MSIALWILVIGLFAAAAVLLILRSTRKLKDPELYQALFASVFAAILALQALDDVLEHRSPMLSGIIAGAMTSAAILAWVLLVRKRRTAGNR